MDENGFLYDVAFSFHSLDEGIATQLNDLLSDRFKTFIYSEQQKKLAGTDGEKNFNAVYGGEARVVIVFYRPEWGETPFTRIEQTAIRNRAFSKGYDFTLLYRQSRLPNAAMASEDATVLRPRPIWIGWCGGCCRDAHPTARWEPAGRKHHRPSRKV